MEQMNDYGSSQAIVPPEEVIESASATTGPTSGKGFVPYIAFLVACVLVVGIFMQLGYLMADVTGYIFDQYQSGEYDEFVAEFVEEFDELQQEGGYEFDF